MFQKVLIANRGEIAVRIIRACHELGVRTVAVYSEADRNSLHVKLADEAFCIGPPPAGESYLHIPNILSTAEILGVDAIHPGYGFLAENAQFAEICADLKIAFIGPSSDAIRKMGDKAQARQLMLKAGVPVVPGSEGPVNGERQVLEIAQTIGFPLMLKASAGGGGRGMRVVHTREDLRAALQVAQREAEAAFGDGELYIEKYVEEPRHVEVQILADGHGNVLHLGARDCSVQRRHQKLIEESPPPRLRGKILERLGRPGPRGGRDCSVQRRHQKLIEESPPPRLREKILERLARAALRAAQAIHYTNAGTIEFLVDKQENIYFMEMNTRIQVEHPVTEMVTGLDLVKEQIRIAAGERLPVSQRD